MARRRPAVPPELDIIEGAPPPAVLPPQVYPPLIEPGACEQTLRAYVAELGDLLDSDATLVEMAYALARRIDDAGTPSRDVAALVKELRAVLQHLDNVRARRAAKDESGEFTELENAS